MKIVVVFWNLLLIFASIRGVFLKRFNPRNSKFKHIESLLSCQLKKPIKSEVNGKKSIPPQLARSKKLNILLNKVQDEDRYHFKRKCNENGSIFLKIEPSIYQENPYSIKAGIVKYFGKNQADKNDEFVKIYSNACCLCLKPFYADEVVSGLLKNVESSESTFNSDDFISEISTSSLESIEIDEELPQIEEGESQAQPHSSSTLSFAETDFREESNVVPQSESILNFPLNNAERNPSILFDSNFTLPKPRKDWYSKGTQISYFHTVCPYIFVHRQQNFEISYLYEKYQLNLYSGFAENYLGSLSCSTFYRRSKEFETCHHKESLNVDQFNAFLEEFEKSTTHPGYFDCVLCQKTAIIIGNLAEFVDDEVIGVLLKSLPIMHIKSLKNILQKKTNSQIGNLVFRQINLSMLMSIDIYLIWTNRFIVCCLASFLDEIDFETLLSFKLAFMFICIKSLFFDIEKSIRALFISNFFQIQSEIEIEHQNIGINQRKEKVQRSMLWLNYAFKDDSKLTIVRSVFELCDEDFRSLIDTGFLFKDAMKLLFATVTKDCHKIILIKKVLPSSDYIFYEAEVLKCFCELPYDAINFESIIGIYKYTTAAFLIECSLKRTSSFEANICIQKIINYIARCSNYEPLCARAIFKLLSEESKEAIIKLRLPFFTKKIQN